MTEELNRADRVLNTLRALQEHEEESDISGVLRMLDTRITVDEAMDRLRVFGRGGYSFNSIPVAEQNHDYGDEHQERR